jgi:hypothetical protein
MTTIKLPDSWNDVTINQFIELSQLENNSNHSLMVASILSDTDSEEIKKYDTDSFNRIINHLAWTNQLPTESNWKPILEIDGDKYGFINKLSQLTLGEWVDVEHYLEDYNNNVHKVLAIFYRPLITAINDNYRLIDEYDSNSMEIRAELFKEKVNIGDVYGSMVFFSIIAKMSIANLNHYFLIKTEILNQTKLSGGNLSRIKRRELKRKLMKEPIKKRGLGTLLFTDWQREMLQKLMPSVS